MPRRLRSRISILYGQLRFADTQKMVSKNLTLSKGDNKGHGPLLGMGPVLGMTPGRRSIKFPLLFIENMSVYYLYLYKMLYMVRKAFSFCMNIVETKYVLKSDRYGSEFQFCPH